MLRSSQLTATPSRGVPVALRATVHGAVYSAGILVVIAWFVSVNHGDMGMAFFFGHSCYIYFWSRIFTFLCFNIHLSRRNPGENPAPCWYSRSLIGWLGFLTLPIWDLAGILPERLLGYLHPNISWPVGHVGGWWNIGDTHTHRWLLF